MLRSFFSSLSSKPSDVQVWDCVPLVVVREGHSMVYGLATKVEFTPADESSSLVGAAVALKPDGGGLRPEIAIVARQYIDNPIELGRRQGMILSGTNESGEPVEWYINGAADRFLTSEEVQDVEYDEETAKELESELGSEEPTKLNLNSYL